MGLALSPPGRSSTAPTHFDLGLIAQNSAELTVGPPAPTITAASGCPFTYTQTVSEVTGLIRGVKTFYFELKPGITPTGHQGCASISLTDIPVYYKNGKTYLKFRDHDITLEALLSQIQNNTPAKPDTMLQPGMTEKSTLAIQRPAAKQVPQVKAEINQLMLQYQDLLIFFSN